MASNKVYIKSTAHISAQQPLSDEWFISPVVLQGDFVPALEPHYKDYISPMAARRMTPILKRALVTSRVVLNGAPVDAIVTGTGLGSAACSEKLINAMVEEGEQLSMPTQFMQSTHNTIGSLVAIDSKCHGYNATYSQDGISTECALLDAFVQIQSGRIATALVGAHDELPASWLDVMRRGGIAGNPGQVPASETSVAMLLTSESAGSKCEIVDVELSFNTDFDVVSFLGRNAVTHVDAVMTGINGWKEHDDCYNQLLEALPDVPRLHYKHLSGESCSAAAFGIYASALCLQRGAVASSLRCDGSREPLSAKSVLMVGVSGSNKSLILLKSCD